MDLWRSAPTPTVFRRWPQIFFLRQAPKGRKLEGYQVEKKSEAAQTKPKKLIRRTCPRDHGSDGSGLKWHAPPCSESAAQKKTFRPQRRGLQRSPSGDPEEESPIPELLRHPICVQASV
jgi:hypothetical protein